MAGSSSQANASVPLNSQVKRLMILRGTSAPASFLRRPDSIGCASRVLISTTSPFFASFGTLIRGFSATTASDRHLHLLAGGEKTPVAGARDDDDIFRRVEADAGRDFGAARHGRETERGNTRIGIAVRDH